MRATDLALEQDLDWREAELASLKADLAITQVGSVKHRPLLRALWAMLYAHYEGFCVFAWSLYLDCLGNAGLARNQLERRLAHFSMINIFKELKHSRTTWDLFEFCDQTFPSLMAAEAEFPSYLDSQGNLWPDRCAENCRMVGLQCQSIDTYAKQLKSLVARRNEIAHGKKMFIKDLDEYQQYEAAAFAVMYELAICISEKLERIVDPELRQA